MKHLSFARASLLAALLLAACTNSTVKDTLGLNRSAPDEFRVVSRPPLSVPPQFSLRPPGAVAGSAAQPPADKQAQALVLGDGAPAAAPSALASTAVLPVTASPLATSAESQFLKNAGANKSDPNVRNEIALDRAAAPPPEEERSWWDIFSTTPKKEPVVDAQGEAERIRADKDQGKPVTTGDTPEVKEKDTGWLSHIFGS